MDQYAGYTWDNEAFAWTYDGCNGVLPPSRHEPIPPDGRTFNDRQPLSDDYGHHFTPDENGHFYPSDRYGRYRSKSPEKLSAYQSRNLPTRQREGNRSSGALLPNPESKCLLNLRRTSRK